MKRFVFFLMSFFIFLIGTGNVLAYNLPVSCANVEFDDLNPGIIVDGRFYEFTDQKANFYNYVHDDEPYVWFLMQQPINTHEDSVVFELWIVSGSNLFELSPVGDRFQNGVRYNYDIFYDISAVTRDGVIVPYRTTGFNLNRVSDDIVVQNFSISIPYVHGFPDKNIMGGGYYPGYATFHDGGNSYGRYYFVSWGTNQDVSTLFLQIDTSDYQGRTSRFQSRRGYCETNMNSSMQKIKDYDDSLVGYYTQIDWGFYDPEKYDYFVSYDDGLTYRNITEQVTSRYYNKPVIENGDIIYKRINKITGSYETKSFYITGLDERHDFIKFISDSRKDIYLNDNLFSKYVGLDPLSVTPNVFKYYYSFDNRNWEQMNLAEYDIYLTSDKTIYLKLTDENDDEIWSASREFDDFGFSFDPTIRDDSSQTISFEEQKEEDWWLYIYFKNFNPRFYRYFIQKEGESWEEVNDAINVYELEDELTEYCAKITDLDGRIVNSECYTTMNINEEQTIAGSINKITKFINDHTKILRDISNLFSRCFAYLPADIRNLILFIFIIGLFGGLIYLFRK